VVILKSAARIKFSALKRGSVAASSAFSLNTKYILHAELTKVAFTEKLSLYSGIFIL